MIKCKNGGVFSAIVDKYVDAEWRMQEVYYKAQGCIVESQETVSFSSCKCDHCKSLNHDFEKLMEEVKEEGLWKN